MRPKSSRIGVALGLLFVLGACSAPLNLEPPSREEVQRVLGEAFGAERLPLEELALAVREQSEDGAIHYRAANAEERAALFLPPKMSGFEVEQMRSKYFPTWRVLFHETRDGKRIAPYAATFVEVDGRLSLLLSWHRALRLANGELRPDFRPHPGTGPQATNERVMVPLVPAWDPR